MGRAAGCAGGIGMKTLRTTFAASNAAFKLCLLLLALGFLSGLLQNIPAWAEEDKPTLLLLQNVKIFDGKSNSLSALSHVLIEGNLIKKISPTPLNADGASLIDAHGMTLIPGLIDAHAHTMFESVPLPDIFNSDIGYLNIAAAKAAEKQLLRGFTSVRDVGGPSFGLKRAIDEGLAVGPRIYPSGAMISQTGGHGDFGAPNDVPREVDEPLNHAARNNIAVIADGTDAVLQRAREQLRLGATQLKLMAGGGVSSNYDPLDVAQYTEAEFHAAVEVAENWGTYVTVHAYTPRAIKTAVAAGVKCIEHGQLLDEATAKLLAEKGIWLSLQPFLGDEDSNPMKGANRTKQLTVAAGTDKAYQLAKKYKLKVAFGTDALFDAKLAARQGKKLAKLVRWFTPVEVLRMATSANAELLALSGPRNPYPGKLGVIEEGALADILIVNGDPLQDINLIADPDKNFALIMKDGKVYKNTIPTCRVADCAEKSP
jgi:imidazolonepropionase-like amidohydrolase